MGYLRGDVYLYIQSLVSIPGFTIGFSDFEIG